MGRSMERLDRAAVAALRTVLDSQPTTPAKVKFAWALVAGAAIAQATSLSWSGDGSLYVRAKNDVWKKEILRARAGIVPRLAELLGPDVVRRIVVDVEAE